MSTRLISANIPDDVYESLKEVAQKERTTMTHLIVEGAKKLVILKNKETQEFEKVK